MDEQPNWDKNVFFFFGQVFVNSASNLMDCSHTEGLHASQLFWIYIFISFSFFLSKAEVHTEELKYPKGKKAKRDIKTLLINVKKD